MKKILILFLILVMAGSVNGFLCDWSSPLVTQADTSDIPGMPHASRNITTAYYTTEGIYHCFRMDLDGNANNGYPGHWSIEIDNAPGGSTVSTTPLNYSTRTGIEHLLDIHNNNGFGIFPPGDVHNHTYLSGSDSWSFGLMPAGDYAIAGDGKTLEWRYDISSLSFGYGDSVCFTSKDPGAETSLTDEVCFTYSEEGPEPTEIPEFSKTTIALLILIIGVGTILVLKKKRQKPQK